jgi:hypothetical protein
MSEFFTPFTVARMTNADAETVSAWVRRATPDALREFAATPPCVTAFTAALRALAGDIFRLRLLIPQLPRPEAGWEALVEAHERAEAFYLPAQMLARAAGLRQGALELTPPEAGALGKLLFFVQFHYEVAAGLARGLRRQPRLLLAFLAGLMETARRGLCEQQPRNTQGYRVLEEVLSPCKLPAELIPYLRDITGCIAAADDRWNPHYAKACVGDIAELIRQNTYYAHVCIGDIAELIRQIAGELE